MESAGRKMKVLTDVLLRYPSEMNRLLTEVDLQRLAIKAVRQHFVQQLNHALRND